MSFTPMQNLPRTRYNGNTKTNGKEEVYDISTISGSSVIYLTDNGLSGGNALYSEVFYVIRDPNDSANNIKTSYTLSGDLKTLTITATKQTFTGITVVGIPVLGSVTMVAVPNGTTLKIIVYGK